MKIINHLSESIHVSTFGTMHERLALYDVDASGWGWRSKSRTSLKNCSCDFTLMEVLVIEQQVLFRVDFVSGTLDLRVQCPRVGLQVKM